MRAARRQRATAAPRPARAVPLLAVLALLVSSCGLFGGGGSDDGLGDEAAVDGAAGDDGDGGRTTGDGEADPGSGDGPGEGNPITAEFVDGGCRFEPPAQAVPRCGTVTVPADWETGTGEITLAVAVFESTADAPAADPVVYLEGGPGGHALETLRFVAGDLVLPLMERGDVVFFDQRGAGLSTPRLECPELTTVSRDLEDAPDLTDAEVDARTSDALSACSTRLTDEGVDLSAYNSINNAHDVEAIRVALGYDEWNLLGVSYGTRLGLEVLRRHPDGVRTAVFDSVLPPQADRVLENPATFVASYTAVVDACGREPACVAQGDLGDRLAAVIRRYEDTPVPIQVQDHLQGTVDEVFLDGELIVGVVNQALYSPFWFTDLPELVTGLEAGEYEAAQRFLSQQRTNEPFVTLGMFYAIECNEEIAFADPDTVAAAVPADPFGLQDRFEYASNVGTSAFDTCRSFGSSQASAESIEAVESDIPTLLLAGRYDPVTPPEWAERAAETLENSFVIVAPHKSHGVSPGPCGMSVVRDFLDDPTSEPGADCFAAEPFSFVGGPREVALEPFSYDTPIGATVSGLRPQGWQGGELLGDSYRQESLLDNTLLFQLTGNSTMDTVLVDYVSNVFAIELGAPVGVPGPGGRDWDRRQGRTPDAAAELYETSISGFGVYVLLVTTPAELDHTVETVLLPALQAIEVEPLS